MREIKFRYIIKDLQTNHVLQIYFSLKLLERGNFNFKPSSGRYEILSRDQFVGLKDSKGKDLYERDILKWDEKEWGSPYNELVTWDYLRESDWSQFCEVVGNATEHPHLLGE